MKNKKFLPLVILVGVVALLGILLAVLSINFIGDGLRDAFDAKQKK